MRNKLPVFLPALLIAGAFTANFALGGITIGILSGINPNVLHFNSAVSKTAISLGDFVDKDNLSDAGNSSIESSSSGILGIPIGINVRYLTSFYLLRLGFINHFTFGGTNKIITGKNTTQLTAVEDYSMRMIEIPFTFAFNIRSDQYTRFYAGAGPTLFFGSAKITHDNGKSNTTIDEDLYSGWTLGVHLVIGGEVSISRSYSLSMEIIFNYGNKAPVLDESITDVELIRPPQHGESEATPEVLGIYKFSNDNKIVKFNPNYPAGLDFTGFQLIVAFNFFVGLI